VPDLQTLLFKYGLPGIPLSTLIVFKYLSDDTKINVTDRVAAILVASLLLGYVVQQFWFLIFELTGLRYNSPKRAVLTWLNEELSSNTKLLKMLCIQGDLTGDKLYSVWESLLYRSDSSKQAVNKLKGIWNSFHSNMAISIGLILGLIYYCLQVSQNPAIPIFFALGAILLFFKAYQSKILVDQLEKNWAQEYLCELQKGARKK